jgi:hypothetical protein
MTDSNNNTGYRNSGYWNSGYGNSGYWNSGNGNSGDWNSGNGNSGYWNSGYGNSGYWNSGYWNSGIFNTDEPKMRAFGKESDMTMTEFLDSELWIDFDIPLNVWVELSGMTDAEKAANPSCETTGGYLKTHEYKEAWAIWWEKNRSDEMTERIKKLPNFDPAIFEEITGIKIDETEIIEVNGKRYRLIAGQRAEEALERAVEILSEIVCPAPRIGGEFDNPDVGDCIIEDETTEDCDGVKHRERCWRQVLLTEPEGTE